MNEATMRLRLRAKGYRNTFIPPVELIITAAKLGKPKIDTAWTSGRTHYDHRIGVTMILKALGLSYTEHGDIVTIDKNSFARLSGIRQEYLDRQQEGARLYAAQANQGATPMNPSELREATR